MPTVLRNSVEDLEACEDEFNTVNADCRFLPASATVEKRHLPNLSIWDFDDIGLIIALSKSICLYLMQLAYCNSQWLIMSTCKSNVTLLEDVYVQYHTPSTVPIQKQHWKFSYTYIDCNLVFILVYYTEVFCMTAFMV